MSRLYLTLAFTLIGTFNFGYVIGFSSPAIPILQIENIFDKSQSAWFGSLMTIGMLCASLFAGIFLDRFGRRNTMSLTNFTFIVGWTLMAFTQRPQWLYVARFTTGFASGFSILAIPTYISEISPRQSRGFFGSFSQLSITIGILSAYALGMVLHWRSLALVANTAPFAFLLLSRFIPESPRWLILRGRRLEASLAFKQIRGDVSDESELEEVLDSNRSASIGMSDFLQPSVWEPLKVDPSFDTRIMQVATAILVYQQLTGINVVMLYSTSLFLDAGLTSLAPHATLLIGVLQVAATTFACCYMDRLGRRKMLTYAGIGMAVANAAFALYFYSAHRGVAAYGSFAVLSMTVYIVAFSLGWGPAPMLVVSEIFPLRAKGAASVPVFISHVVAFLVSAGYYDVTYLLGGAHVTFSFFALFCCLAVVYVDRCVPETRGRTLEDIEKYFLAKQTNSGFRV